ncbi:MAG: AAA family ATPase [Carboxydocellales bacterium]
MFINELYLKNFRGFDEKIFRFDKRFSVFAGENGSGKTAVLEGLCVALGGWLFGFDGLEGKDKRNIYKNDIRKISAKVSSAILPQTPVQVKCLTKYRDRNIEWSRSVDKVGGHTTYGGLSEVNKVTKEISNKIYKAEDTEIILPIVAYYSAARLWSEPIQKSKNYQKETIRIKGYSRALSFGQSIDNVMKYIDILAHRANKNPDDSAEFDAIMEALKKCLDNIVSNVKIDYDIKSAEIVVIHNENLKLHYSQLSDGYRCMISLIADIAYKMSILNPHLKEFAIAETTGVVLIDELDLHLHPKWQRVVVNDLKKIFPKVQFIATTHSPFIIQSLEDGELITLDRSIDIEYSGESIEDIAEDVMGIEIPQYSKHKQSMYEAASKYFAALNNVTTKVDVEELKVELDLLSAKYGDNVAYYAFIEQKYYAKKAELEEKNETCR